MFCQDRNNRRLRNQRYSSYRWKNVWITQKSIDNEQSSKEKIIFYNLIFWLNAQIVSHFELNINNTYIFVWDFRILNWYISQKHVWEHSFLYVSRYKMSSIYLHNQKPNCDNVSKNIFSCGSFIVVWIFFPFYWCSGFDVENIVIPPVLWDIFIYYYDF